MRRRDAQLRAQQPAAETQLLDYLASDAIVHSLDMYTAAKREFLERFNGYVLEPRGYDYKVQFPGPRATTRSRRR